MHDPAQTLLKRLLIEREIRSRVPDGVTEKDKYATVLASMIADDFDVNGTRLEPKHGTMFLAVEKAITEHPEITSHFSAKLEAPTQQPQQQAPVDNPWSDQNWNLTEQMRITKQNPTLAEQLKSTSGK